MAPLSASPSSKRCNRCGETLPLEAFYVRKASPDGHGLRCKPCELDYQRERRAAMKAREGVEIDPTASKRCPRCGETLPLTAFARDRGRRDGASMYCKPCSAIRANEYRAAHPERVKASKRKTHAKTYPQIRAQRLIAKFGLTREAYEALQAAQGGGCAICGRIPEAHERKQELCVDHDHATGAVRGLLCGECNSALGLFRDSPALLRQAIHYLAKHGTTD